jgi:hypothetical protein
MSSWFLLDFDAPPAIGATLELSPIGIGRPVPAVTIEAFVRDASLIVLHPLTPLRIAGGEGVGFDRSDETGKFAAKRIS